MASVLSVPDNQSEDKHVESSLVPRLDEAEPASSTGFTTGPRSATKSIPR